MDDGGHDGSHHGDHHHSGFGGHQHGHHHSDDSTNRILSHSQGGQWPSKRGWLVVAILVLLAFALVVFA